MPLQKPLSAPRGFETWLQVGRTNLKVHRALNLLLGQLDLSLAQHEILVTIRQHSGLTQRELSEHLLLIKSNATALLQKLEIRGLVCRTPDTEDSRIKRLSLTRKGNELVQQSYARQTQVINAMVSILTDDQLELTADIMSRVGNAIDELIEKHQKDD